MPRAVRTGVAAAEGESEYIDVQRWPWGRWAAEIRDPHHTVRKWLDTFDTAKDATHTYNITDVEFRGHCTKINFPDDTAPAPAPSWVPTSTYYRHDHLPLPLPESLHETCGANASSSVDVALAVAASAEQHGTRLVPKEQDIWDRLNEFMMMDDSSFWSPML
nr:ethylene-responsive transcription factor ERF112-like [Setaria viridis]